MGKSSKECLDIIWTDMKTGVEGREVFPLETKKKKKKIAQKTFWGFRVSGFLIEGKNPQIPQIYEKHTLSIENGFIEKQFSVKNQFWQGSFIQAWMLDTTGAFARNKNRHLALKGWVASL